MDFKTLVAGPGGLASVPADALLVVLSGETLAAGLPQPLADAAQAALNAGDLALKAGQSFFAWQIGRAHV